MQIAQKNFYKKFLGRKGEIEAVKYLSANGYKILEKNFKTYIGEIDVIAMEQGKGKKVAVYPISENEWLDMGQLPELEQMRKKLYGE